MEIHDIVGLPGGSAVAVGHFNTFYRFSPTGQVTWRREHYSVPLNEASTTYQELRVDPTGDVMSGTSVNRQEGPMALHTVTKLSSATGNAIWSESSEDVRAYMSYPLYQIEVDSMGNVYELFTISVDTTGIRKRSGATGAVLWSQTYSTNPPERMAIIGDTCYATSLRPSTQNMIRRIDASGTTNWETPIPAVANFVPYSIAASSTHVAFGGIVEDSANGYRISLQTLDAITGQLTFASDYPEIGLGPGIFGLRLDGNYAYLLFQAQGTAIKKIDLSSGSTIFTSITNPIIQHPEFLAQSPASMIIINGRDGTRRITETSGTQMWSASYPNSASSSFARRAGAYSGSCYTLSSEIVFTPFSNLNFLRVRKFDPITGTEQTNVQHVPQYRRDESVGNLVPMASGRIASIDSDRVVVFDSNGNTVWDRSRLSNMETGSKQLITGSTTYCTSVYSQFQSYNLATGAKVFDIPKIGGTQFREMIGDGVGNSYVYLDGTKLGKLNPSGTFDWIVSDIKFGLNPFMVRDSSGKIHVLVSSSQFDMCAYSRVSISGVREIRTEFFGPLDGYDFTPQEFAYNGSTFCVLASSVETGSNNYYWTVATIDQVTGMPTNPIRFPALDGGGNGSIVDFKLTTGGLAFALVSHSSVDQLELIAVDITTGTVAWRIQSPRLDLHGDTGTIQTTPTGDILVFPWLQSGAAKIHHATGEILSFLNLPTANLEEPWKVSALLANSGALYLTTTELDANGVNRLVIKRYDETGNLRPTQSTLDKGVSHRGTINALTLSDNSYYQLSMLDAAKGKGAVVNGYETASGFQTLKIVLESSSSRPNFKEHVLVWNWSTSSWVSAIQRQASATDNTTQVQISNPGQYVQPFTNQVKLKYEATSALRQPITVKIDKLNVETSSVAP